FISFFFTQITDLFTWGYVFAEVREYIEYNLANSVTYFNAPWYNYILMVAGFLVPPISFFLIFGFFQDWKKHLVIIIPVLLFFVFHSWHPNKQERFILPVLPFIIILGTIGWQRFLDNSEFWKKRQGLYKSLWVFFWTVNLALGIIFTFSYHKKARIQSMEFLGQQPDYVNVIVESTHTDKAILLPRFYSKSWKSEVVLDQAVSYETISEFMKSRHPDSRPNYLIALENKNIAERIAKFESNICELERVAYFEPGIYDSFIHWLNPVNRNETCTVYKLKYPSNAKSL
ncbi:MAG: hypothetical protein COB85_00505, partial [Bacteroidetes bacterium]